MKEYEYINEYSQHIDIKLKQQNNQYKNNNYNINYNNEIYYNNDHNNNSIISSSTIPTSKSIDQIENIINNENNDDNINNIILYDDILRVIKKMYKPCFSVWFVFSVTLGIFPSLIVHLQSQYKCINQNDRFQNDLFIPFLFLLINLFDFLGRIFAGISTTILTYKNIWIASFLRIFFFPLFMTCNVENSILPILFLSDYYPILFTILLAFSNGYIASLSMMYGPSLVKKKDSTLAGTIMLVFLTLGLLTGSLLSSLTVTIVTGFVK